MSMNKADRSRKRGKHQLNVRAVGLADPESLADVTKLAALSLTKTVWRDTCIISDWHVSDSPLSDGYMLRIHSATPPTVSTSEFLAGCANIESPRAASLPGDTTGLPAAHADAHDQREDYLVSLDRPADQGVVGCSARNRLRNPCTVTKSAGVSGSGLKCMRLLRNSLTS